VRILVVRISSPPMPSTLIVTTNLITTINLELITAKMIRPCAA
jgi:hypothetical protein